MKTMKLWILAFAMLAVFSLASCSDDDSDTVGNPIFAEAEKANDLYKLSEVSFAEAEPDSINTYHLDTVYIYNYSHFATMPVTYTLYDDLKDTLSIEITEGSDYVNRLKLQGSILFPSSIVDGKPLYDGDMSELMPVNQSLVLLDRNVHYTSSTTLYPRTFLKYTGTYHYIVQHLSFTATYEGQTTRETVCVRGHYRHSHATIAPIDGSYSVYAETHPID